MKAHFQIWMVSLVLGSVAWGQETALYQQVNDYLNEYRSNQLGAASLKQTLVDLNHQRVLLTGEVATFRDQLKKFRKSKRQLHRADKKQEDFSDDYNEGVESLQAKIDGLEKELESVVQKIEVQKARVDAAKENEITEKQFEKKMAQFRERSQLITNYQQNRAKVKGETAPAQDEALKGLLARSNSDLRREYSQPRIELKPLQLKLPEDQAIAVAKPSLPEINVSQTETKPMEVNANVAPTKEQNHCQDEALMEIAKGAITQNPQVLSELFEISKLKMAYALNELDSGKETIEASIQHLLKNTDLQKAREKVTALYRWKGRDDDLKYVDHLTEGKASYWTVKTRLDNAHASSLILLLSKEKGKMTDFTEADAATVWAVERIRMSQNPLKFALGKYDGNRLNFSTEVYNYMTQRGYFTKKAGFSDPKSGFSETLSLTIDEKNKLLANTFKSAFDSLSQELKKCLSSGECKPGEALSAEQMNTVRGMVAKLAHQNPNEESRGAHIDLQNTRIEDGVITLAIKK